jgi:hypothetical protein
MIWSISIVVGLLGSILKAIAFLSIIVIVDVTNLCNGSSWLLTSQFWWWTGSFFLLSLGLFGNWNILMLGSLIIIMVNSKFRVVEFLSTVFKTITVFPIIMVVYECSFLSDLSN